METLLPYQIQKEDYPRLLRYQLSPSGVSYMEDLISEVYFGDDTPSMKKLVTLGMLLRVNTFQTGNLENETVCRDVSKMAEKYGGVEQEYLAECIKSLVMRGILTANPRYDRNIAVLGRAFSKFRPRSF